MNPEPQACRRLYPDPYSQLKTVFNEEIHSKNLAQCLPVAEAKDAVQSQVSKSAVLAFTSMHSLC